jgi:hypothetical protein
MPEWKADTLRRMRAPTDPAKDPQAPTLLTPSSPPEE